ncbi:MAG: nucleotidyltransferase [Candidatus Korarchaeota archaeon NZ13-K]|nr:MAG: nucleotidyltransferase [Candidatus Korarchaeota archaeon NZ13-K]
MVLRVVEAIRRHIPDARIILFGSRARGDALKESDIDLIVVSKAFEGVGFTDRATYILKILWREGALPPVDVDLLCYTPEEFEEMKKRISIVSEALKYGVEL